MNRVLYVIVAILALSGTVMANDYVYRSDGFYYLGDVAYIRSQVYNAGSYYQTCNGYYAQYPGYYSYSYTKAPVAYVTKYVDKPAVYPTPPAYTPGWKEEVLKYAAARDDAQLYATTLQALGIQGQVYPFQSAALYSTGYRYNAYVPSGQTAYGYSFNQLKEQYGATDMNALYLQANRLAENGQAAGKVATSEFMGLVDATGTNAARVAEILAKGEATAKALKASEATSVTRTVTQVTGVGAAPNVRPMPKADARPASQAAKTVLQNRCAACHTGAQAQGGFDVGVYDSLTPEQKNIVFLRVVTPDPKLRMPRLPDGSAGPELPNEEKKALLDY